MDSVFGRHIKERRKNMSVSFLLPSGVIPVPSGPGGG